MINDHSVEGYNAVNSRIPVNAMLESALYMNEDNKIKLRGNLVENAAAAHFTAISQANTNLANVSTNFIRAIVRSVEKLFDHNPIAAPIMRTGGDITKAEHYSQFVETVRYLQKQLPSDKTVFALVTVQSFLASNKALFKEGFKQENRNVQLLYFSLANSMFVSGALLLATYTDFLSGNAKNSYFPELRAVDIRDVNIINLRSIANDIAQGKIYSFLQESVIRGRDSLKESFIIPALFGATIAIFWFIRDFIVYFFKLRKSFSDWMSSYSIFLEMRANSLKGSNQKVAATYADLSKKFQNVAKLIEVEASITSKETVADVKKISGRSEQLFNADNSADVVSF